MKTHICYVSGCYKWGVIPKEWAARRVSEIQGVIRENILYKQTGSLSGEALTYKSGIILNDKEIVVLRCLAARSI